MSNKDIGKYDTPSLQSLVSKIKETGFGASVFYNKAIKTATSLRRQAFRATAERNKDFGRNAGKHSVSAFSQRNISRLLKGK